MSLGRSVRRRLLSRGHRERWRDGERAELGRQLGGVEAGSGLHPVLRCELDVAVLRPVGQDAEEVAQVGLGVEAVQTGRGHEGEDVARCLTVIVAAHEEPALASDGESPFILPMSAR